MTVLLCPLASPGYLYPAVAVGRDLQRLGTDVVVLTTDALRPVVESAGLTVLAVADCGGDDASFDVGAWHDTAAVVRQFEVVGRAVVRSGAERMVTSVLGHGALLAARAAGLSVAVLGFACDVWSTPIPEGVDGVDGVDADWCHAETLRLYEHARAAVGLSWTSGPDGWSPLRGDAFLLRGRTALLPTTPTPGIVDVGPCWWEPPLADADLDRFSTWRAHDDRPIVYVHLGRTFGGQHTLLRRACALAASGGVRVVIETGRSGVVEPPSSADLLAVHLPAMDPIVRTCAAVMTNATTSPVLAALRFGRPLLVDPAGSEQPSLAAATRYAGVARQAHEVVDADSLARLVADPVLVARVAEVSERLHALSPALLAAALPAPLEVQGATR